MLLRYEEVVADAAGAAAKVWRFAFGASALPPPVARYVRDHSKEVAEGGGGGGARARCAHTWLDHLGSSR